MIYYHKAFFNNLTLMGTPFNCGRAAY